MVKLIATHGHLTQHNMPPVAEVDKPPFISNSICKRCGSKITVIKCSKPGSTAPNKVLCLTCCNRLIAKYEAGESFFPESD